VKSKYIDPLPPIDHSKIEYKPFEKNFYTEHSDITGLSPIQVKVNQYYGPNNKINLYVEGITKNRTMTKKILVGSLLTN
jgi:hypothetical protein